MDFKDVEQRLNEYGFAVASRAEQGVSFDCRAWPQALPLYELHGPVIKFDRRSKWGIEDRMSHKLHIEDQIFKMLRGITVSVLTPLEQPFKRFNELNLIFKAGEQLRVNGIDPKLTALTILMDMRDKKLRLRWEQEGELERFIRIGHLAALTDLSVEDRLSLIAYKLDLAELKNMLAVGTPFSVALELFNRPTAIDVSRWHR